MEYKVFTQEASASFTFNLVDTDTSNNTVEVYLQSLQDYSLKLTGVVSGN